MHYLLVLLGASVSMGCLNESVTGNVMAEPLDTGKGLTDDRPNQTILYGVYDDDHHSLWAPDPAARMPIKNDS